MQEERYFDNTYDDIYICDNLELINHKINIKYN